MVFRGAGPLAVRLNRTRHCLLVPSGKFNFSKEKAMKKLFVIFVLLASLLLASCQTQTPVLTSTPDPTLAAASVNAVANQALTQTAQAVLPSATPTLMPATPTLTAPTMTPTATQVALLQLKTAKDVRDFFQTKTLKWVAGGEGLWVAGAQGSLVNELTFADMPEGMTLEVQCIQYHNLDGELVIKKVCADAETRFSKTIPANTVVTAWLEWVIEGSENESWPEGFTDKPCKCADGDCRDE